MKRSLLLALASFAVAGPALLSAGADAPAYPELDKFKGFDFVDGSTKLPYRLFVPPGPAPADGFPLLLFFHGMGSIGDDNQKNLFLAGRFGRDNFQKLHPCIVLVPQCPVSGRWVRIEKDAWNEPRHSFNAEPTPQMAAAMKLLDKIVAEKGVDRSRIYVGGSSMGGFATWDVLCRKPGFFAAAFPICGGCDLAKAPVLAKTPLWIFHGEKDDVVRPSSSREMAAALKAAGASPRFTEYPGVAHDSWNNALAETELFDWLFSQKLDDFKKQ